MNDAPTSPTAHDAFGMTAEERRRLVAKSDIEVEAAARADLDAQPMSAEELARMGRPIAKVIRQKLGLSREAFSSAYGIPLAALERWERQQAVPTETEEAYLRLIERRPDLTLVAAE
jgi:putative transcriptional regulator